VWSALIVALLAFYALFTWALQRRDPPLTWDWTRWDPQDLSFCRHFGPDFLWGVATAAHQVEGGLEHNNWSDWERQTGPDGRPRIHDGQRAGLACDHLRRFREDIALMVALGVRSYRFSLEWSRLEPEPGVWDEAAFAHYHEVLDACEAAGLEPMVTLHHFTHPSWWEARGGFEREENLADLLRYTERAFREDGARVRLWCTLNEPEVFASQGWFSGLFPPGKKDPQLTGVVLANLLRAHGRMYRLMKGLPGGHDVEVGLVKDIFQFDAKRRWFLPDALIADALDRVMNESLLAALETGHFTLHVPGMISIDAKVVEAAGALDFVGLNYYSRYEVRFRPHLAEPFELCPVGAPMTDMPYAAYPEGIYRALRRLSRLKTPIFITENGVADARDDRREDWIGRYLYAVARAKQDGVDVRGYYYWTLMDNFEWAEGWAMKFGLYGMDPATRERVPRAGARAYTGIIQASRRA